MAANADAHFDPKVLSFLQDTSSIVPHRDSGSARALEKSGELGKHNVSMYIQLRMTMWTLLTLLKNLPPEIARELAPPCVAAVAS